MTTVSQDSLQIKPVNEIVYALDVARGFSVAITPEVEALLDRVDDEVVRQLLRIKIAESYARGLQDERGEDWKQGLPEDTLEDFIEFKMTGSVVS